MKQHTVDQDAVQSFLAQRRIAVIGASNDPRGFGGTVYRLLRDNSYDVVAVNPNTDTVAGDVCYGDVAAIPGDVDAAILMVNRERSAALVRECLDRGVHHIWLFKGLGAPGSVSDEAVDLCGERGASVVAGACPFMFLEPVTGMHRLHRTVRRWRGTLPKAS
jgi:acyl-CoA synthetase (NDP forming)